MLCRVLLYLGSLILFASAQAELQAREYQQFIGHNVRVCDADTAPGIPPAFDGPTCRTSLFYRVDPQERLLRVELLFEAEPALLESGKPLGLFVSAKASSEAVLNGIAIGANGKPGRSALREVPGNMDAVFFVPKGTLRPGENRLVMRFSSMNGGIALDTPIHTVALAPYRDPRQPGPATWFALITFGLFAAGFVYFGVRALRGKEREASLLTAAISLMAALQLAAESARDTMPYPYPLHDLRLTLILVFAIGLGLSAAAYVLFRLFEAQVKWRALVLAALFTIMVIVSVQQPGFDLKTSYVLMAATLTATSAGFVSFINGNRKAGWLAFAGIILAAAILWLGGMFLDTVLYLIVALSLLWLFFRQAIAPEASADRGDKPADIAAAPRRIELLNNGKVEFINTDDVVRFGGAGDYVEVFLDSGRSALYSASLAALERDLPATFIRVHRSHIINAAHVQTLTRQSAGIGELLMLDGAVVPISRRNMAGVRATLMHK